MGFDLTILLFMLACVSVRSRPWRREKNLRTCKRNARCPDSSEVIVRCAENSDPVCQFQCPLGHPLVAEGQCGEQCSNGYHVKPYRMVDMWDADESCMKNTRYTKYEDRVIEPATSWHDTICGKPEDHKITTILYADPPTALRHTLNELSLLWLKTIPKTVFDKLCKVEFTQRDVRECSKYNMIVQMTSTVTFYELYWKLHNISEHGKAAEMFNMVLAPFLPNHPLSIKRISKTGGLLETKNYDDVAIDEYGNVRMTIHIKLVIPWGYNVGRLMYVNWAVRLTAGDWMNMLYVTTRRL